MSITWPPRPRCSHLAPRRHHDRLPRSPRGSRARRQQPYGDSKSDTLDYVITGLLLVAMAVKRYSARRKQSEPPKWMGRSWRRRLPGSASPFDFLLLTIFRAPDNHLGRHRLPPAPSCGSPLALASIRLHTFSCSPSRLDGRWRSASSRTLLPKVGTGWTRTRLDRSARSSWCSSSSSSLAVSKHGRLQRADRAADPSVSCAT